MPSCLVTLQQYIGREDWRQVPQLVALRYKEASTFQKRVKNVLKHMPDCQDGYGQVFWNPDKRELWAVFSDNDTESLIQKWRNALKVFPEVVRVRTEVEHGPYDNPDWIQIKKANALTWYVPPHPFRRVAKIAQASPAANAMVNALVGGSLGYAGGALAENILPAQLVEKNKLRKTLGLLGAGVGAASQLPRAVANIGISRTQAANPETQAPGPANWSRAVFGSDAQQILHPEELAPRNNYYGKIGSHLPVPPARWRKGRHKLAFVGDSADLQPFDVNQLQEAIWRDVRPTPMGTPPQVAAMNTGVISGVQQMHGGRSLLSPRHFMHGLAAAGVDAATATVVGKTLGALGGLTPPAQQKLQQLGVWGGFMRGMASSLFQ